MASTRTAQQMGNPPSGRAPQCYPGGANIVHSSPSNPFGGGRGGIGKSTPAPYNPAGAASSRG